MKFKWLLLILVLILIVAPASATTATTTIYAVNDAIVARSISSGEPWIDIVSGAGTAAANNYTYNYLANLKAHATTVDNYTQNYKYGMTFDTSPLADDLDIVSVNLNTTYYGKDPSLGGQTESALIIAEPLDPLNFDAGDYLRFNATELAPRINWSSISSGNATFALNTAGIAAIDKTGYTVFYALDGDIVDGAFSGSWTAGADKYFRIYGANQTNPPRLDIIYNVSEDITPPDAITNLQNTSYAHAINFTWDYNADINKVMVYKNGTFLHNVTTTTTTYDYWRGLSSDTEYTISTKSVDATGNVNDTWVNLTASTGSVKTWPKLMMTFDDGYAGDYTRIYPIISPYNYNATIYQTTSFVTNSTYLTVENLTILYNAGWDIANHGRYHVWMTGCTTAENIANVQGGMSDLIGWGLSRAAYHFAYPASALNATTMVEVKMAGALTARDGHVGNCTIPITTDDELYDLNVTTNGDYPEMEGALLNGTTNQTVILLFHDPGSATFSPFIDWVYDNGYETITISQWYTLNGYLPIPITDFIGTPTYGYVPLSVQFNDTTLNTPIYWNWSFGDGTYSNDQNVTHTYTHSGLYNVSLNATNGAGTDIETKTNYINVSVMPNVIFSGTPLSGATPLTVSFTDASTTAEGTIDAWSWMFGDGSPNSTTQNPTHAYTTSGLYSVSLTVTNSFGISNSTTYQNYVNAGNASTPTPTPTPTQTPSNATGGTRDYSTEETAIPFWLWAVIIILGSSLLVAGLFGRHLIFGIMSTMCFAAAAFASPMVSFFYQEVVLSNESEVAYSVFPMKWLVTQPWVAWLLWGMALLALLVVVYGVIVGMAEIKKPGDEFLEDDWLDRREF